MSHDLYFNRRDLSVAEFRAFHRFRKLLLPMHLGIPKTITKSIKIYDVLNMLLFSSRVYVIGRTYYVICTQDVFFFFNFLYLITQSSSIISMTLHVDPRIDNLWLIRRQVWRTRSWYSYSSLSSTEDSRLSSLLSSLVIYVLAVSGPLRLKRSIMALMLAMPTLRFSKVGP